MTGGKDEEGEKNKVTVDMFVFTVYCKSFGSTRVPMSKVQAYTVLDPHRPPSLPLSLSIPLSLSPSGDSLTGMFPFPSIQKKTKLQGSVCMCACLCVSLCVCLPACVHISEWVWPCVKTESKSEKELCVCVCVCVLLLIRSLLHHWLSETAAGPAHCSTLLTVYTHTHTHIDSPSVLFPPSNSR